MLHRISTEGIPKNWVPMMTMVTLMVNLWMSGKLVFCTREKLLWRATGSMITGPHRMIRLSLTIYFSEVPLHILKKALMLNFWVLFDRLLGCSRGTPRRSPKPSGKRNVMRCRHLRATCI